MKIFHKVYKTELITFRTYKRTSNHIDELCKRLGGSKSDIISFAVHLMARQTDSQLLRKSQIMEEDIRDSTLNSLHEPTD